MRLRAPLSDANKPRVEGKGGQGEGQSKGGKSRAGAESQTYQVKVSQVPNVPSKDQWGSVVVGAVSRVSMLELPSHPQSKSLLEPIAHSEEQLGGLSMVASVMWGGRNQREKTMRLTKPMALGFVRSFKKGENPATLVMKAWGCKLLVKGSPHNGNKTNLWSYPPWSDGPV